MSQASGERLGISDLSDNAEVAGSRGGERRCK